MSAHCASVTRSPLAVALLAVAVPVAIAAFVATTSNTGNSFQSAAIFPGAIKMASGAYTRQRGRQPPDCRSASSPIS